MKTYIYKGIDSESYGQTFTIYERDVKRGRITLMNTEKGKGRRVMGVMEFNTFYDLLKEEG